MFGSGALDHRTSKIVEDITKQLPRGVVEKLYISLLFGEKYQPGCVLPLQVDFKRRGSNDMVLSVTVDEADGCKLSDSEIARLCLDT